MEYIDAEVTAITTSHALTPDVDVRQLIPTEQHRIFKKRSGLLVRHPEPKIEFSRPSGYAEILDLVEAHAYELSLRTGKLVPMRSRPRTGTRPITFQRSQRFTRLSSRRHTNTRPRATPTSGCRPSAASCALRTGMRPGPMQPSPHVGRGSHATSSEHSGRSGGGPFHARRQTLHT